LLVADDVAVNVKMMNLMLSRFGYRCDSAGNGLEVLEAIGRQTYDVILMDVNMPEMDGLEATREIFRRLPPARRPRIVALTANVMSDDQQQFRQAGMEDFLSKPVSVADLKAVLLRCAGLSGTAAHDSPISPPQPFPLLEVPSEPALDPKMLASLRQTCQAGSPDALNELLALVEVEFPDLFQALGQARDSNRLTQAAHALKGGASSIGALKLGKLAQALEKKGQAGVPEASAEELSAIEQQIDLVLNELRHIVSQKKS
jgi:CheY-like chemotaxis protein